MQHSEPSFLCEIKSLANSLLEECGIWSNPYFVGLEGGALTLEAFRASQGQFYFAVEFFSRPMAGLIARLPDYASRVSILRNVVEEHGEFRITQSHAATFQLFLQSLGGEPVEVEKLEPMAPVHAFNSVLLSVCLLEELEVGIACIGIIEHAFAVISARTGAGVVSRGWVARDKLVHYALHAELDQVHAEEFFHLLAPSWENLIKRRLIRRGFLLGAHVFDRLYRELATAPPSRSR